VKILDFGLAKVLDDKPRARASVHTLISTEVGIPYGTGPTLLRTKARGERVDARADLFLTGSALRKLTGTWRSGRQRRRRHGSCWKIRGPSETRPGRRALATAWRPRSRDG